MNAINVSRTISIRGLFQISRPINLLMVAFSQLMTAFFLVESTNSGLPVLQDYKLYLMVFSTSLITAAGYMINDYYDVKIDYVNRPGEVVVGKGIKRRVVILLHTILNISAIAIGLMVSPKVAMINFGAAFLLWLYSNKLKREPFIGNLTVAFLTGLAIFLIGFHYQKSELLVLTYAIFAFFLNLIREIIKDIEDRPGDRKHGCRTLPIVIGFRKTKGVIFLIAAVFVCAILIVTFKLNRPLIFYYFSGLGLFFTYFMYLIYQADRKDHFTQLSALAKILMLVGTISMGFL
ncbi:geranylgeranylglycerol-phosphate geranylgeranyltransferase [Algoriphagus halophytocola]|uniref:Geranylgeranylglycerol-phosphate geranylgeranyltransferase n=1 Tax=Algoriphagus halophytocola TaxID=2991499 RepID=A0ABY6MFU0_9BACT|nr:geranylgeranylglycerol-phosphate geranylgeranyltransferase [Algoriphagus sp. TR-M5]UZD22680.1 geranylgeranylglycerol-phosphate geranylgeranyltransferase [Algoriphagus sp. TR-M5]